MLKGKSVRVASFALATGLLSSHPARAASADASTHPPVVASKPNAAQLFKSGEAKYAASDFAAAVADFKAADDAAPSVEAARYIGLCEDKLGHYRAAAAAYNRFLAHPPPRLVDEVGPLVVRVREIEQMPGAVRVESDPSGASLTIDGAPEKHETPYEAHLTPGKHLIRASAPEHEALEREVEVTFASTQTIALSLGSVPAPAPSPIAVAAPAPPPSAPLPQVAQVTVLPASPPAVSRRTVAFAAAGIAVLGAGLATTFGVLALTNKSSYQSGPTLSNADNGNNDAAYADGALALTIAAGVTSLVLFLTDAPAAASAASAPAPVHSATFSASPFLAPHGGGAGALLRF